MSPRAVRTFTGHCSSAIARGSRPVPRTSAFINTPFTAISSAAISRSSGPGCLSPRSLPGQQWE
ncbi:MAG: hypothetical protein ACR2NX_14165 [Chthoniobacterales bacterium]